MSAIRSTLLACLLFVCAGHASAFGTHNLYIKLNNEQGSGQFVFGTLGGIEWTCNTESYDYNFYPNKDGNQLTIAFAGPFTDRPCKQDAYYFTARMTFEVGVKVAGQPGWYDSSVCTIDFGMAWGDGSQACIPVAVGPVVLACIGLGARDLFRKHYGDSFSASCANPYFKIVPPQHTSTGYYSWDVYWPVPN